LLLGLLDADTTVWLSPSLKQSDAASWLRFHTGCRWAEVVNEAQFVWVGLGDELPTLHQLRLGSDTYPDQSATCVIEVRSLHADEQGWLLQGPGIPGSRSLAVQGLPPTFESQWADNHSKFPRGVDVFFTTPTQVAGLPRTTQIVSPSED
jgi:alpha-D-ribose 1-methylphosphonate 5-triphosphate synthase subunit PhnH